MNKFIDFPTALDSVLREIAQQNNYVFKKETHYNAINRELHWICGNRLERLDFDFSDPAENVKVIHLVTVVPTIKFLPTLLQYKLLWFLAKTTWKTLSPLSPSLTKNEYKNKVEEYLTFIKQTQSVH